MAETKPLIDRMEDFAKRGRFLFWGEGAFSQYLLIIWALESDARLEVARTLLHQLIEQVAGRNHPESREPLSDPYQSTDGCLTELFSEPSDEQVKTAIESWTLYPLVLLAVRRQMRSELESLWPTITRVHLAVFRADNPLDVLHWTCERGREFTLKFESPQKWSDLTAIAAREDRDRLPGLMWDNSVFGMMFLLAYQHRMLASLIKRLDAVVQQHTALTC